MEFSGSLGRNRYSWTWRSCFCYEIRWKTRVSEENSRNTSPDEFREKKSYIVCSIYPGPGEAVFAIRFDGKPEFQRKIPEKRPRKISENSKF